MKQETVKLWSLLLAKVDFDGRTLLYSKLERCFVIPIVCFQFYVVGKCVVEIIKNSLTH